MSVITFSDLRRYRRCPYAFMADRKSGMFSITAAECMEMSVHDAVLFADHRRMVRGHVERDDILSAFWDSWDRHFPDIYPPSADVRDLIRFGERCIGGYVSSMSRRPPEDIVAVGLSGTVTLPDGTEVLAPIDVVYGSGRTAVVCRYVCDTGLRSSKELSADSEMKLCALWVLENLMEYDRVKLHWEFLGSKASSECTANPADLRNTLADVAIDVAAMSDPEVLPRETEYCGECPHHAECPRFLHEISLKADAMLMGNDDGVKLVDEYAELQEKIDALRRRQAVLEMKQKAVAELMVRYSDEKGYMALTGTGCKALIRHERKVELPEDKTELIALLRNTGRYDDISMVNYSRLRSDIAKGLADPDVARLATVTDVGKVYLRRRSDR